MLIICPFRRNSTWDKKEITEVLVKGKIIQAGINVKKYKNALLNDLKGMKYIQN